MTGTIFSAISGFIFMSVNITLIYFILKPFFYKKDKLVSFILALANITWFFLFPFFLIKYTSFSIVGFAVGTTIVVLILIGALFSGRFWR